MPTTFFGWVGFLLEQYGPLFAAGTAMTLLISLSGTVLGFIIGLLVAIVRTIEPARGAGSIRRALLGAVHALMNVYIQVFRGTPMIVQAIARLPVKYPMAASSPPKTSHNTFPIILIVFLFNRLLSFYLSDSNEYASQCETIYCPDRNKIIMSITIPMFHNQPTYLL